MKPLITMVLVFAALIGWSQGREFNIMVETDSCNLSKKPLIWTFTDSTIIIDRFNKIDTFTVYHHFLLLDNIDARVVYFDSSPYSYGLVYNKKYNVWLCIVPQKKHEEPSEKEIYPIIDLLINGKEPESSTSLKLQ